MRHPFYLRVAYLGTGFFGWQVQSTLRSVQATLWDALRRLDPEAPMPQGTGRTDAGVHAKAQGTLILTLRPWEPYRLLAALNAHLPSDVRVMEVLPAHPDFWPRHHAVAKRYVYRIVEGPSEDPFDHGRRWHVHRAAPLDRAAMSLAAQAFPGERDFSSFRHKECAARTPIRRIHAVSLVEDGPRLDLVFEGNRFLMHQVRIMAGTLVEVGKGRIPAASMPAILEARDRSQAGITAPPHGLCLEKAWYQARWGIGEPSPWPEPTDERGG